MTQNRDKDFDEMVARAEQAAEQTRADVDFGASVLPKITQASVAIAPSLQQNSPVDLQAREAVFATAHDLKGSAASFGHPYTSRLAASLCRLLRPDVPKSAPPPVLVKAHIEAIMADLSANANATHDKAMDRITSDLEMKVHHHLASEAGRV